MPGFCRTPTRGGGFGGGFIFNLLGARFGCAGHAPRRGYETTGTGCRAKVETWADRAAFQRRGHTRKEQGRRWSGRPKVPREKCSADIKISGRQSFHVIITHQTLAHSRRVAMSFALAANAIACWHRVGISVRASKQSSNNIRGPSPCLASQDVRARSNLNAEFFLLPAHRSRFVAHPPSIPPRRRIPRPKPVWLI